MDAVGRNALDLLLDADEPDLLVVEHQDDDGQVLAPRRLQVGDRHQQAAIAREGDDRPVRIGKPGRHGARHRIAHAGEAVRGEEFARPVGFPFLHDQQPARAGVAGRERVARQHRAGDLDGALRRQPGARRVEGVGDLLAEGLGGLLAPAHALRRQLGERGEQRLEVGDDLRDRPARRRRGSGTRRAR